MCLAHRSIHSYKEPLERQGVTRTASAKYHGVVLAASNRLKIVFTTTISGSLAFNEPTVKELKKKGHEVAYVAGDTNQVEKLSAKVIPLPMKRAISPIRDLVSLAKWCLILRRAKPDILVAGTPKASLLSLSAGRLVRVPKRIYILHGAVWDGATGIRGKTLRIAERISIQNSTSTLAVSKSLSNLVTTEGVSKKQPDFLGHGSIAGIDLVTYDLLLPTEREKKKVLYIGRLAKDKNIDALIESFDLVRNQSHLQVELHIVGSIDESAPPTASTIERLKTNDDIKWHGFSSDVRPFLRNASVLAFPSSREGLPQVVLEAQATGVPVAAWSCTGVIDAVSPANRTLLSPIGDFHGLAASILRVINDEQLSHEISQDGRQWVEAHFNQIDVATRTTNYILES